MTSTWCLRLAAVSGFLVVALGAFGAHSLKSLLQTHQTLAIWEKAVFYHFIHAVMLFVLAGRVPLRIGPWLCFLGGILVFSGSLYLMAVTNLRWLGAITPIGGVSFIAGWVCLAIKPPLPEPASK